jgi:hypothetical protein
MAFAIAAVLLTGGLMASNMGFKVAYTFNGVGQGGAISNENHLALPFYPHLGLTNAASLKTDINAAGCGLSTADPVQRFNPTINSRESWFGAKVGGTNFNISACESYFVQMPSGGTCSYVIAGTHNPDHQCTFNGAGVAGYLVGENTYALPFHTTANNARELLIEISAADFVQRFDPGTNSRQSWFGGKIGGTNFNVVPGEGYFIQMPGGATTTFKPDHY